MRMSLRGTCMEHLLFGVAMDRLGHEAWLKKVYHWEQALGHTSLT